MRAVKRAQPESKDPRLSYPLAPQARTLEVSKRELKEELTHLLIGYLTA